MGLFPRESAADQRVLDAGPRRMALTRELGTRRLVIIVCGAIAAWYVIGKVEDRVLLRQAWPPLRPDEAGLTVVGTLDSRMSYDQNLLRVVEANKSARAELTDYGWNTIFSGDTPLRSGQTGDHIRSAIEVDDSAGYAMLTPFLKMAVDHALGHRPVPPTPDTVITWRESGAGARVQTARLGALLARYAHAGGQIGDYSDSTEGGDSGGHEVDHGLPLPPDALLRACPVVVTGAQFTGGWLEEHPATILEDKTYTAHLDLTPEGRSRFFQWSRDHANEHLCFLLNGQLETAGRIQQTLDVNQWDVGPITDRDSAKALVDYVNAHPNGR